MITRFTDALCGCCRRSATGFGYAPRSGLPILWVCDDEQCLALARTSYTMKQDTFSRIEALAVEKGGAEGGAYLDGLGKTDLATMTIEQWQEFCRTLVAGYRSALVSDLQDEAPF